MQQSDTINNIILRFQEQITIPLPAPETPNTNIDVCFDVSRYIKRLNNTCEKLLQLQSYINSVVSDEHQRDVRSAIIKRRRQFIS